MGIANPQTVGDLFDKADTLRAFVDYVGQKGIADQPILDAINGDLAGTLAQIGGLVQFNPGAAPLVVSHNGTLFAFDLDAAGKPSVVQVTPIDATTMPIAGASLTNQPTDQPTGQAGATQTIPTGQPTAG